MKAAIAVLAGSILTCGGICSRRQQATAASAGGGIAARHCCGLAPQVWAMCNCPPRDTVVQMSARSTPINPGSSTGPNKPVSSCSRAISTAPSACIQGRPASPASWPPAVVQRKAPPAGSTAWRPHGSAAARPARPGPACAGSSRWMTKAVGSPSRASSHVAGSVDMVAVSTMAGSSMDRDVGRPKKKTPGLGRVSCLPQSINDQRSTQDQTVAATSWYSVIWSKFM